MVPNVHNATNPTSLCLSYQIGDSKNQLSFPKYKVYLYLCYYLLKGVILTQFILASPITMKDGFNVSTFTLHSNDLSNHS